MAPDYTRNELLVLWHLKRHGPWIKRPGERSIIKIKATELDMRPNTVAAILRHLEGKSVILRHYEKGRSSTFASGDNNPLVKVELIDPTMWLPEMPAPLPLGIVMDQENRDLYERTCETPTEERVIEMLLVRNDELQAQINKLQEVIEGLAAENSKLAFQVENLSRPAKKHVADHLKSRVRDALTPEQWDSLSHRSGD